MNNFAFLNATEQADLVKRKELKPQELVGYAIEQIEKLNPNLNAVVTATFDQALAEAKYVSLDKPFAGVPFLLKDLIASLEGVRKTSGSRFLQGYVSHQDSTLVARLKHAGLIIVGKTNTPEFGALPTTEPRVFGPCRNPWDLDRTPGGSSGGSAAAVAAGMVPMAHGNDGGGSIRIPAACCGLFGLKPSRGRNPLGPEFGECWGGLVAEHVITRSVRDSARLLDATCGPDVGDPYYAPQPQRPFAQEVGKDPGRLRIAFSTSSPTGVPVHTDCIQAVKGAALLCEELGHEVEESSPAFDGRALSRAYFTVFLVGIASEINYFAEKTQQIPDPEQFEPLTWEIYQRAAKNTGVDYVGALQNLHRIARDVAEFFTVRDIWLTPTLAEPPVPLGTFEYTEKPMDAMRRVGHFMPFTQVCNITGQPAMTVPLHWNPENLPIGTHFVGGYGQEATLFRLASQLEAARPWTHLRPPLVQ